MTAAVSSDSASSVDLGLQGSTVVVTGAGSGIALLLSPVSSFVTGAVIPLDGGQVIPRA